MMSMPNSEVERSGAKIDLQVADELTPPDEEYLLYFSGAKQSEMRAARVETCILKILDGLGLRDV